MSPVKMGKPPRPEATGIRQFLDLAQQRAWIAGETGLPDTVERSQSLEHRFKYAAQIGRAHV